MNIVSYQPWSLLNKFQNDLNRLYEDGFGSTRPVVRTRTNGWTPAVDIREEAHEYVIFADVPGTKAEDIEVTLDEGVLTIKGERAKESADEGEGYKRVERVSGTFVRRFTLPETSDTEAIVATVEEGVLKVRIPKQEKAQPRRIPVN